MVANNPKTFSRTLWKLLSSVLSRPLLTDMVNQPRAMFNRSATNPVWRQTKQSFAHPQLDETFRICCKCGIFWNVVCDSFALGGHVARISLILPNMSLVAEGMSVFIACSGPARAVPWQGLRTGGDGSQWALPADRVSVTHCSCDSEESFGFHWYR